MVPSSTPASTPSTLARHVAGEMMPFALTHNSSSDPLAHIADALRQLGSSGVPMYVMIALVGGPASALANASEPTGMPTPGNKDNVTCNLTDDGVTSRAPHSSRLPARQSDESDVAYVQRIVRLCPDKAFDLSEWRGRTKLSVNELERAIKVKALSHVAKPDGLNHGLKQVLPRAMANYVAVIDAVVSGRMARPDWWEQVRRRGSRNVA